MATRFIQCSSVAGVGTIAWPDTQIVTETDLALADGAKLIFDRDDPDNYMILSGANVVMLAAGGANLVAFSANTIALQSNKAISWAGTGADTTRRNLKVPTVLFDHSTDGSTTHTDGTEDTLYTDTIAASQLATDNEKISAVYSVVTVSSATAARRIKVYFGGTVIWDSGSLTIALAIDFNIRVDVIRESSTVVRCTVGVETNSTSAVPYSTYTRITGLTLSNTQIIKVTGIASGTGAASADIVAKLGSVSWAPAG